MRQPSVHNLISVNQSGERESGQKPAEGDQQSANQANVLPSPVSQTPAPREAGDAKTESYTEQPNPLQVRDVTAQEDMVFWAGLMFVAAVATFFVTSVGTYLIWRQVRLTREAVEDTGEATVAMRDANDIARDTGNRQLRAYISPESLWYEIERGQIEISVANRGQTPATDVVVTTELAIEGKKKPPKVDDLGILDPGVPRYVGVKADVLTRKGLRRIPRATHICVTISYRTFESPKEYCRTQEFRILPTTKIKDGRVGGALGHVSRETND